jgi:hypothetical protein
MLAPMPRVRLRTVVLVVAALVVLVVGGGFAFFALIGDDAPAPARVPASSSGPASGAPDGAYVVADGDDSYAGYRVDERYLGVGVRTAVGRTGILTGGVRVAHGRVTRGRLSAQLLGALHSDQDGRDRALQTRGLETVKFPGARFALAGPIACRRGPWPRAGRSSCTGRRRRSRCACPRRAWPAATSSWPAARRSRSRTSTWAPRRSPGW